MENLSITTIPVTIRVMEVGGKRLTMAVFSQIPEVDFFDDTHTGELLGSGFLGWAMYKQSRYIIFYRNGVLLKDSIEARIGRARNEKAYSMYAHIIKDKTIENLEGKVDDYTPFLQNKDQIYIAI